MVFTDNWKGYELLDSGNLKKLERFGAYILIREETKAKWKPSLPMSEWKKANASYAESGWIIKGEMPRAWIVPFDQLKFEIRLADSSKQVGVFPEQAVHWLWVQDKIKEARQDIQLLNLFGYTGAVSLAAAAAGASVTHIEANKSAIAWGKHNQEISELKGKSIRWIQDDAVKFVKREIRRGKKYDAIVLDPPMFGRGPKGEVWKIERDLDGLLADCRKLLSSHPVFVVLTVYSGEESPAIISGLMKKAINDLDGSFESGGFILKPNNGGKTLPMALFTRWSNAVSS